MISVVIPTHNRSDLLPRAIESVMKQTLKNFEIIIVSDGSTDATDKIMEKYMAMDDRIKYISYHPNKGGNFARNTGIKEAKGDLVAFLDDDDEWYSKKLEKQLEVFKENKNIGLVYTGVNTFYVQENISYTSTPIKKGDLSREILLSNYIGTTSTVIIKKEILKQSGYFDENLSAQQDYDLWIRICQNTLVGAVDGQYVKYYNHPEANQISQQIDKYLNSMEYIKKKYQKKFKKLSEQEKNVKRSNEYLFLAAKSMRKDNHKLTRRYTKKSLEHSISLKAIFYYLLSNFSYSTILKVRSII